MNGNFRRELKVSGLEFNMLQSELASELYLGEEFQSFDFLNESLDHDVYHRASNIDLFHEIESKISSAEVIGSQIIVSNSIQGYSDVNKELKRNGSIHNNLTLANWNEISDNSDAACTSALDVIPVRQVVQEGDLSKDQPSISKSKKRWRGNKHEHV